MKDSSHSALSLSSLLCQETETCLDEQVDEENFINLTNHSASDTEEDEYIEMLFDREISVIGFKRLESSDNMIGNRIECARLDAITWILNTRALFGFRFQTAYLSVTYFDRFLSSRAIDSEKSWAIQLLSVACLSLAAKMEECRVPALSEFPVEKYNFTSKVIQRMELLVLNTLEWKMGSVTPFAYIHYFITKFCKDSPPRNIVSRTVDLILAIMIDINLMDYRPSVLSGAATMAALDQELTRQTLECKINAFSSSRFLEIGDVFNCYNRMRELDMEKMKIPNYIISPGGGHGFDNSSVTCAISTKRKRLTFNDCDQNYGIPEEKRHG
uniref:Putative cyclin-D5-1 n=1 Tax=Davidia involucrata TaxID=16924 RepID=A0A5B6YXN1_DAVIN